MRRIAALAAVAVATGCAINDADDITTGWHGHRVDDLVAAWGPPDAAYKAGDGSMTVGYSHSRGGAAFVTTYPSTGGMSFATAHGATYYCNAVFSTDSAGIITSSRWDGNIGGCNRFFGSHRGPGSQATSSSLPSSSG